MCGIFGVISSDLVDLDDLQSIAKLSQQRGKDSSGLIQLKDSSYSIYRYDGSIVNLIKKVDLTKSKIILGHSRLVTNGHSDNQPIIKNDTVILHNGIIVNVDPLWEETSITREQEVDTEIIAALVTDHLDRGHSVDDIPSLILDKCKGVVATAILLPKLGKLLLFSNNGSLYIGKKGDSTIFSSEIYPLNTIGCEHIEQVKNNYKLIEIEKNLKDIQIGEFQSKRLDLVPELQFSGEEERLLKYDSHDLTRCTKCILPETMPFIYFDEKGVCNYCNNYQLRNVPKSKDILFKLIEEYRRKEGNECIVPFSGGRDSCYGLHLIVKELGLKALAYTYDWGMVTDLGRRNISRMCSQLEVENIIVAADITKKREYIRKNITAWLKSPHLGMISIFTAGDKHFFRHLETIKKQTGIGLNLWGVNPLEVTHFKAGFLGIPPDFEEEKVYSNGFMNQFRYQMLRLKAMIQSPGYFNNSMWDTLSGEYYRSVLKKTDYFHIFDYWRWEEDLIDLTLLNEYDWEKAPDTSTTWRIGDGTAAFYNYIYYTVAGFTEHDTFRSNQIREGQLSREKALELVQDENRPRYPNLKWYLDSVGLDFKDTIKAINTIPQL